MEITEKVAYLKGLAEGMELDTDKKVGKHWTTSPWNWRISKTSRQSWPTGWTPSATTWRTWRT